MPLSVLVVERDTLTRETITLMLDAMNYAVVAVEDSEQAYPVIDAVAIDVAILSLQMNDPDGVVLAGELKARRRGIKVVVVSGREPPEKLDPFVDAFVRKPFSLHAIDQAIKQVKASSRASRAA